LIFDPNVAGPLKLVLVEGSNKLREHGVVDFQELNWTDLEVSCGTVIYVVRPEAKVARQIASQISSLMSNALRGYTFQIHFVPKRSFLCDQILRDEGVFDVVRDNMFEYPLGFIPYETDVLSLGLSSSFAQVNLQKDDSTQMFAARALLQLQDIIGPIPNIQVKGDQSKKLLDMILRLRLEAEEEKAMNALKKGMGQDLDDVGDEDDDDEFDGDDKEGELLERVENLGPNLTVKDVAAALKSDLNFTSRINLDKPREIDTLLIIDRGIDMVTTMCTPLTYESVIDDVLGIRNGHAYVDAEVVDPNAETSPSGRVGGLRKPKVSMSFNSADLIYREARDMNIASVLSYLNRKARDIKDNWNEAKTQQVEGLHNYVQTSLRSHVQESQLLPRHIGIVQGLRNTVYDLSFRKMWNAEREMLEGGNQLAYIEDCIARQEPWTKVLRLSCLQSLIQGGLSQSSLDSLRKSIVQTYGFEFIFTLDNLEKLGMLKRRGSSGSSWSSLVSAFRLIPPSINVANPEDIAYVTSGYAPLSVRVVELAINPGWENCKDILKKLPGRTIYKVKQPGFRNSGSTEGRNLPTAPQNGTSTSSEVHPDLQDNKKVMLVFFNGGVTFAEIAALRFVSRRPECPFHIIIASTCIMNGRTFLQSIAHEMVNNLQSS